MRVRVPLGGATLTGYIVSIPPKLDEGVSPTRIREITARLEDTPSISPDLLSLAEWMAEHYLTPLGQCLRLVFPGAPERESRRVPKDLSEEIRAVPSTRPPQVQTIPAHLDPLKRKVLEALTSRTPAHVLICASMKALAGLYLETIQATVETGRSALLLVPQTRDVEPLEALFNDRWGSRCQAYHAGLTPGDRLRAWSRIRDGEADIVIGTRSAIFVPLHHIGLIIVAREDHEAYKAENAPRFDARVVAAERAVRAGAVLVMASPHPSLESVQATGPDWAALPPSAGTPGLPPITVVDLREEPPGTLLSAPMTEAIAARLGARQKVLLFLNRKGYAPLLLCRDCGEAIRCPACSTGLAFHKKAAALRCPHCGHAGTAPEACPGCQGVRLVPFGFGTEALEEAVQRQFPAARVARLEREGAARERANCAILSLMQDGEFDILIGTQLVITRHPRPVASLIGLIYPDAALHLPDFRAAERTYHTLREVLTLADPDAQDAEIVLQTYMPQHHVMQALRQQDPAIFYKAELADREALGYPPFGRLIGLQVSGTKDELVASAAARWTDLIRRTKTATTGSRIAVLGPIPASPPRLRKRFRWRLLVKGRDAAALQQAVRTTLTDIETDSRAGGLRYDIEVDPQSLL
jgi:primosomal protein N' (replication factor Y)